MNRTDASDLCADLSVDDRGRWRVRFDGSLTIRTASVARDALRPLTEGTPDVLLFDLSGLTELDAAGLILVTSAAMRCRRAGVPVSIVAPAGPGPRRAADRVGVLPLLGRAR